MIAFTSLLQQNYYRTCAKKEKWSPRISYLQEPLCSLPQVLSKRISLKRPRQNSFGKLRLTSSKLDLRCVSFPWSEKVREIVTLLLVGSLIPNTFVHVSEAAVNSSPNSYGFDSRENCISCSENATMLHSLAQNTIALQSYKQAFDLPIDSETLSLYPSLESGDEVSKDSFSNQPQNIEEVRRQDMSLPRDTKGWFYPGKFSLFYDKYKEKFPWTAWFKVEGKETVNEKENVREGKRGRYVFVIVTLLVIACVVPMIQYYSATLTSVGEIQSCTNNGSSTLHCSKKWVLTLAVANGQQGVDSTVAKVFGANNSQPLKDPNNPNKAYLFNYTLHISLSKSRIAIEYPLVYLQDFNNQPYEVVYESNSNGPLEEYTNPCVDSWGSSNPTCGYAYNPPNDIDEANRIYDSQGFCCECGVSDYLAQGTREGLSCNLLGSLFQIEPSQAAHCLRFDPLWYSGFRIGTYQLYYWVTVNISKCPLNTTIVNSSICSLQTLQVGPTSPLAYSDSFGTQIQDIGDFSPWQGTPTYSNKYLMKPDYCQDSQWWCLNRTADIPSEIDKWMLVDTTQVTLSGDECDKIGVSYSAFQDQSSRCLRAVNSCLSNQLEDFYKQDLKALQEGTSGSYFVQFFGKFDGNDVSGASPKMRFWTDRTQSSDILLEFAAEELFHVVDVSDGKIIDAKVDLVQAYSTNGRMTVTLQNTGQVEAAYEVSASCPKDILPILAQQVYIQPNQTKNVTFRVDVENTHGGNFSCNISLQNSIGQSISSYKVMIESSGINVSTGPQAGQPSGSDGSSSTNYDSSSACQKSCGSFFNIICFFEHSCWLNILYVILVVVALIVGGCIGIKLFMHFGMSFLMDLFKMPQRNNTTRRNYRNHRQLDTSVCSSCNVEPYVAPPAAVYYVPQKHHRHERVKRSPATPQHYYNRIRPTRGGWVESPETLRTVRKQNDGKQSSYY